MAFFELFWDELYNGMWRRTLPDQVVAMEDDRAEALNRPRLNSWSGNPNGGAGAERRPPKVSDSSASREFSGLWR
jgi:hypothetical protein